MAQIDTIGLLRKAYKKIDEKRKTFTAEYQNRKILDYNTKHGTSIKPMKSAYDLKQKKMMKDYKKGIK